MSIDPFYSYPRMPSYEEVSRAVDSRVNLFPHEAAIVRFILAMTVGRGQEWASLKAADWELGVKDTDGNRIVQPLWMSMRTFYKYLAGLEESLVVQVDRSRKVFRYSLNLPILFA